VDDQEGWVVGWGNIYHTTNGGQNWDTHSFPSVLGDLTDVYFINADTGWIVGTYQIILKTTNGGEDWIKISNTLAGDEWLYSVKFADANNGIAVGGAGFTFGIVKVTHDGGETWTDASPDGYDTFNDVDFIDADNVWVCGLSGALLKSSDGGHNWSDCYIGHISYDDIHFDNQDTGILIGGNVCLCTFDGGQNWDTSGFLNSLSTNRFHSYEKGKGVAVTYYGDIFQTDDFGFNWENLNRKSMTGVGEIGFFDEYNGIGLSGTPYDGYLVKTIDGGYTWYQDTLLDFGNVIMMHMEGSLCCVINDSSQLFKTINGTDWTVSNAPDTSQYWWDFQFVNENIGFMSGYSGMLFKTIDGGQSWIDISLYGGGNIVSIHFVNEYTGWIIDYAAKSIMKTESGGNSWSYRYLGSPDYYQPRNIQFVNENTGYVTTKEGIIYKTTNSGNTWVEQYDMGSGLFLDIYFISEEEGWYKNFRRINHTVDGGLSWSNDQTFGSANIGDIFFLNSNQGWLSGGCSLIAKYKTTVNISEPEKKDDPVHLFPNPATDRISVGLTDNKDKIKEIELFSINGLRILNLSHSISSNSCDINISELPAGNYIVKLKTEVSDYSSKFTKK